MNSSNTLSQIQSHSVVLGVRTINIWISGDIIQPLTYWYMYVKVAEWWKSCSLCLYSLCEEGVGVSSSCSPRGSWGTWNGTPPEGFTLGVGGRKWGWANPWDGNQVVWEALRMVSKVSNWSLALTLSKAREYWGAQEKRWCLGHGDHWEELWGNGIWKKSQVQI